MATALNPAVSAWMEQAGRVSAAARIRDNREYSREVENELELVARYQDHGDRQALARLVDACLPRVESLARRYRHYPVAREDLAGEGYVGLLTAINRFDRTRGVRLITYATYWIRAYMVRHIANSWGYGKTGMGITRTKVFFKLRRENARCRATMTDEDERVRSLAATFALSEKSIRRLLDALEVREFSMEAHAEAAGRSEVGFGIAADLEPPDGPLDHVECETLFARVLGEALGVLDEREVFILKKRYGKEPAPTFAQLGRELGLSRERVRQIEGKALAKMKKRLIASGFTLADLWLCLK